MGSNRHGKRPEPSFARSVLMYVGFIGALAVVAMVNAGFGGATAQDAALAQADAAARSDVRIEMPAGDDPSLPVAAEVLSAPTPFAPAEAATPTF